MMRSRASTLLLIVALPLAACTVGPDYHPAAPAELGVPDRYSVNVPVRSPEDITHWWTAFNDPLLGEIVEQARTSNLDVAQAVARLRQARESLRQSRAQLLPEVSGSAGYTRSQNVLGSSTVVLPDGTTTTISGRSNAFSAGLDVSYQVGLFGEIRRSVEASRASYEASGYDYATVLLSVESEAARNYILARLYQQQLSNARASLAIQDDNLEIAGFRVQAGLVTSVDVEQARAQRAQTAATIPTIEQNYNAAVSRLGVLTGQAPGALKPRLEAVRPIPQGPADIATGVPADTLRQRPDVRAAERNLAAATAQIGVATAQLYPALALSGSPVRRLILARQPVRHHRRAAVRGRDAGDLQRRAAPLAGAQRPRCRRRRPRQLSLDGAGRAGRCRECRGRARCRQAAAGAVPHRARRREQFGAARPAAIPLRPDRLHHAQHRGNEPAVGAERPEPGAG